jgi:hypothetical protein
MSVRRTVVSKHTALELQKIRELEQAIALLKAPKQHTLVIREGEFKGKKTLNFIKCNADGLEPEKRHWSNTATFGVRRLKLILENLDVVREFVEKYEESGAIGEDVFSEE